MARIFIGNKIIPKNPIKELIRCCSCKKGYNFKGNIFSSIKGKMLICPHCGSKHKIDFTLFDNRIDNLIKVDRLNLTTYTSQYPTQDDDHVKATTKTSINYWPYFATDPAKSLIGTDAGNSWDSANGVVTNQRFHIDLGSGIIIKRIYYENYHDTGGYTTRGAKNFTFWGSNNAAAFAELTYGTDTNWTELTVAQNTFDEHIAADQADPKYIIVTNTTAYRYYAFKFADNYGHAGFMGARRIELQTEDVVFEYVGTGSLTYSGSGICQYEKPDWEYVGSGELAYSGEATQSHTKYFLYDTSGNFVFSGTGIYSVGSAFTGSGSLIYSGEAIQIHTKIFSYVASGALSFSGTGTYFVGFACVGSGTYNFSGVGLYSLGLFYLGIGEFVYSGSATQVHTHYYLYAGSGVFSYSGEAVLRWGDWAEITKETSDFTVVDKGTSNWTKVNKEKGDWKKTIKL